MKFYKQIQNLSNQVDSLQQKIIQLEHNQNILRENHTGDNLDSNTLSDLSNIDFKTSSNAQQ